MADSDTPTPEAPQAVRTSFGEQLNDLRVDLITLAGLTGEAVRGATQCIIDKNIGGADTIIKNDGRIDELKETTELKIYEIFATQQPMAGDLRVLITVLRIEHRLPFCQHSLNRLETMFLIRFAKLFWKDVTITCL